MEKYMQSGNYFLNYRTGWDNLGVGICREGKSRIKCQAEEQQFKTKKQQEQEEEARHHPRCTAQLDST